MKLMSPIMISLNLIIYKQRALKYLNEDYPKEINIYNKILESLFG